MNHQGPTLGFTSRAHFLAWIREQEGPQFFQGKTEQEVCDWFCAYAYGPQVLSPVFRASIRALVKGTRQPRCPIGRFVPQKNRAIFALPPSRHWPPAFNVTEQIRRMPFLYVTTATEYHWRANEWREHRTLFFYDHWRELRAAYRAARLILAGNNARSAVARVRWFFTGSEHARLLGVPSKAIAQKKALAKQA